MMFIKMGCDVLFYRIRKSKLCSILMQDAKCRMLKCRKANAELVRNAYQIPSGCSPSS